jgi:hypothetical protein
MVDSIKMGYGAFVGLVHSAVTLLPAPENTRTEVIIRGFLGEGWLVIIEFAIIIRILWARHLARRRHRKVLSPPQVSPI